MPGHCVGQLRFLHWFFPTHTSSPDLTFQWTLTHTQYLYSEARGPSQTPDFQSWAPVLPPTSSTHSLPASINSSSSLPRLREKSSKWPLTLLPPPTLPTCPIYQQILSVLSSQYIQNLTTSRFLHCRHLVQATNTSHLDNSSHLLSGLPESTLALGPTKDANPRVIQ